MASRKSKTQELLKEYIEKGKPVTLRNEIIMLNERLIGWTAKHYKVDGYVEYEDLKQEGVVGVIDWMEDNLTTHNAQYFSKNVLVICCYVMEKYKYKMMCQFSDEDKLLRKETKAFKEYIFKGHDEWDISTLDTFIGLTFCEMYGTEKYFMPTWFQERLDADEVAVEDKPFEITKSGQITDTIYDMCHIPPHQRMALDAYIYNIFGYIMHGEGKSTQEAIFADVAFARGVTVDAVGASFRKAIKNLRDGLNIKLVEERITWVNDLETLCGDKLTTLYFKDYIDDRDFEEEYFKMFPDERQYYNFQETD